MRHLTHLGRGLVKGGSLRAIIVTRASRRGGTQGYNCNSCWLEGGALRAIIVTRAGWRGGHSGL